MDHRKALVICAEANSKVGLGHVMRCFALAQVWSTNGSRCIFLSDINAGSTRERIIAAGYELLALSPDPHHAVRKLHDANITSAWVVLDGYHFGSEWQDVLIGSGFRVLCIDDGAELPRYSANAILTPSSDARALLCKVPSSTLILAGPRYRPLRHGCYERNDKSVTNARQKTVLIAFGGADVGNVTLDVVGALDGVLGSDVLAIVVLGPGYRQRSQLQDALNSVSYQTELIQDPYDMGAIYERADFAISAAGGTAWEMAASGLPTLLVPVATNQLQSAHYLTKAGAAIRVDGPFGSGTDVFASQVLSLLGDPKRLDSMSAAGRMICDGGGAERVFKVLTALEDGPNTDAIHLRHASLEDLGQVFRLANDPDVRGNSFTPSPISFEHHEMWFENRIASSDTEMFVLDFEGLVIAMVRYDRSRDGAEIDLVVHSAFRGRGMGTNILKWSAALVAQSMGVTLLRAIVMERNLASRNCFLNAGFSEIGVEFVKGKNCRVFTREVCCGKRDARF